jgi:hypothetical protein
MQHQRQTNPPNGNRTTSDNNTRVSNSRRTSLTNTSYSRPGRPKNASLNEFLAGLSLYCACVFLPSLPRYLYFAFQWIKSHARAAFERLLWYVWVIWRFSVLLLDRWGWIVDPFKKRAYDQEGYEMGSNGTGKRVRIRKFLKKFLGTSTAASLWEEFNQQEMRGAVNSSQSSAAAATAYTWGFGWSSSNYPAITMVLFDIQILTMLAVTLAIIRIWFVHMLVPEYLAPRRLEALTRCKSTHLLSSSSYKFDGEARLESAARRGPSNESRGWYDRLMSKASFHWYR